jgi:hypothetical protein
MWLHTVLFIYLEITDYEAPYYLIGDYEVWSCVLFILLDIT